MSASKVYKISDLNISGISYGFINKAFKKVTGNLDADINNNRIKVANIIGCDVNNVALLKQIHSDIAVNIGEMENSVPYINLLPEGDALVTKDKNIYLCITTADCVPVLLYNENRSVIAALHAGWKGAKSGVIENTIKKMREVSSSDINAIIGPAINVESYEVGDEFYESFIADGKHNEMYFQKYDGTNKWHFNLKEFVSFKLRDLGVRHLYDIKIDTFINDNFYSYRKFTKGIESEYGSNVSFICLK